MFIPGGLETRGFALGPGGGVPVKLGGLRNPRLFARNPVDPNVYAVSDQLGLLYTVNNGSAQGFGGSPWTGLETSREDNNAIVDNIAWSPDGSRLAFAVNSDATGNDGVWVVQPGVDAPRQILVDCPPWDPNACQLVQRTSPPYEYESRSILWSPDSRYVLVQVYVYEWDRYSLIVLPRDISYTVRPRSFDYEYGDWTADGRIVVSGRGPDNRVVLGWISFVPGADNLNEISSSTILLDGTTRGLWLQNGVQSGGRLYALGRPGDANGPMRLYRDDGEAVTEVIGDARPVAVKWSPNRQQVYVMTADGRKFVAGINGSIRDITAQVGNIQAVEWVAGQLPTTDTSAPPDVRNLPPDYIPGGVIEGSRFQPGQQVQVAVLNLNLRSSPQVSSDNGIGALSQGEYAAILAGPRFESEYEWWQVQTAAGLVGWIAIGINGIDSVVPAP